MSRMSHTEKRSFLSILFALLLASSLLSGCSSSEQGNTESQQKATAPEQTQQADAHTSSASFDLSSIPAYSGSPYVELYDNEPQFTDEDKARTSFEEYSTLDSLGRCGVAFALIGTETMPTEERGSIGSVKPSGWHTVRYNGTVEGNYLYNRCHLIGYQLSGENANPENLITGTRYLNTQGMLPFEDEVADYVEHTGNHVLYRVTPVFDKDDLVASGVQMEAFSVEDGGDGVSFDVYCYNIQPGISIDYANGDSSLTEEGLSQTTGEVENEQTYVLNTGTKKFHYPSCNSVSSIKKTNRQDFTGTCQELIDEGYVPCGECKP